jgi:hypothetical protein
MLKDLWEPLFCRDWVLFKRVGTLRLVERIEEFDRGLYAIEGGKLQVCLLGFLLRV